MNLRIKEICKEKSMSIGELAERIGVVRESLSRIISSGSTSSDTLQRIADALGVHITDLFEREPEPEHTITCPRCGARLELKEKE